MNKYSLELFRKPFNIINYIKNDIFLSTIFIFVLFFLAYGSIYYFSDGISVSDDHFFQIKFASLIKENGLSTLNNFDWIKINHDRYPLSLFQISLIPFTFAKDLLLGLKLSDVFWAAMSISLFYFFLRKNKSVNSFLFILLILSSSYYSYRIFMGRAFLIVPILILLEVYLVSHNNKKYFFWIFIFHIFWHQATFFIPLAVVFAVEASRYLWDRKIIIKNFLLAALATFLGMSLYPGFPSSIINFSKKILQINQDAINGLKIEGREVYVKDILNIVVLDNFFSFIFLASVALIVYYYLANRVKQQNENKKEKIVTFSIFFLLISFVLGAATISGRFFDFYYPLNIALLSMIVTLLFKEKLVSLNDGLKKYLKVALLVFLISVCSINFINFKKRIDANVGFKAVGESANWIERNSKEGEMIYLVNWSNFTVSFFHNDKNVYNWGLEPKALFWENEELYWKAYNIQAYGMYCDRMADCEEEKSVFSEKVKKLSEEKKEDDILALRKENSQKIINSVKDDFGARFILSSSSSFSDLIRLNDDLIDDEIESISEKNQNYKVTAFKLK